jgi:hypothetical protein
VGGISILLPVLWWWLAEGAYGLIWGLSILNFHKVFDFVRSEGRASLKRVDLEPDWVLVYIEILLHLTHVWLCSSSGTCSGYFIHIRSAEFKTGLHIVTHRCWVGLWQNLLYSSLSSHNHSFCICSLFHTLFHVSSLVWSLSCHLFNIFVFKHAKESYLYACITRVHIIVTLVWPMFLVVFLFPNPAWCKFIFYSFISHYFLHTSSLLLVIAYISLSLCPCFCSMY